MRKDAKLYIPFSSLKMHCGLDSLWTEKENNKNGFFSTRRTTKFDIFFNINYIYEIIYLQQVYNLYTNEADIYYSMIKLSLRFVLIIYK